MNRSLESESLRNGHDSDCVHVRAPAKINIGLQILDKRVDGYHTLRTVYQSIDLCDQLTVAIDRGGETDSVRVTGPESFESGDSNLVIKVLEPLRSHVGNFPPVSIELEKHIPIQAGLGGGSSDAVATVNAIKCLFPELSWKRVNLERMLAEFGADLPFFLHGGTMLGTGTGVNLTQIPDQNGFALIGIPPYRISTPKAYESYDTESSDDEKPVDEYVKYPENFVWHELCSINNDLEPVIQHDHDLHGKLVNSLENDSKWVSLSGSGSAVYALFRDREKLSESYRRHSREFTECEWVQAMFLDSTHHHVIKKDKP